MGFGSLRWLSWPIRSLYIRYVVTCTRIRALLGCFAHHNIYIAADIRGFVKLKKSKNPRKTRKWVGGSSPNSDFNFFLEMLFFSFIFFAVHVSKKKNGYGGGWVGSGQSKFFSDFWIFLNLTRPLTVDVDHEAHACRRSVRPQYLLSESWRPTSFNLEGLSDHYNDENSLWIFIHQCLAYVYGHISYSTLNVMDMAGPYNLESNSWPSIDTIPNRGTSFWTVISKTSPWIIRSTMFFLESVTIQLHARMLAHFPHSH